MITIWTIFACVCAFIVGRFVALVYLWRVEKQPEVQLTLTSAVGYRVGNVVHVDGKLWRVDKVSSTMLRCRRLLPEEVLIGRVRAFFLLRRRP